MVDRNDKWLKFRLASILAIFLILFVALLTRAFQLQIFSSRAIQTIVKKQHLTYSNYLGKRGNIIDSNGFSLASDTSRTVILADTTYLDNDEKDLIIANLRDKHGFDESYLRRIFNKKHNIVTIKRNVPIDQAVKIDKSYYPGVFLDTEPIRVYPWNDVSSALIGFTGIESDGLGGLEWLYNKTLSGKKYARMNKRDAKGRILSVKYSESNFHGNDLNLNLDIIISTIVNNNIRSIIKSEPKILSCSVFLVDINNQALMMNLSLPTFNPNDRESYKQEIMSDRNIRQVFVPGKTLDFLIQNTNTIIKNDKYKFTKKTIKNDHYVIINVSKMDIDSYYDTRNNGCKVNLKKTNDLVKRTRLKIDYGNADEGYYPSDSILPEIEGMQYIGDYTLLNPTHFSKIFLRSMLNIDLDPQVMKNNVGIVRNIDIPELMENNIIILEVSGRTALGSKEYMIKNSFKNMRGKSKILYLTMGIFPINKKYYFLAVSSEIDDTDMNHENLNIWIKIKNDIYKHYKYDADKFKYIKNSSRTFEHQYNNFMEIYRNSFSIFNK